MNDNLVSILDSSSSSCGVKVHEYKGLPVSELVFSAELLKSCETNVCGYYNKSWSCPPASGTIEEQKEKILKYKDVFVFSTKHYLEDSFDYEGMIKGKEHHNFLTINFQDRLGNSFPVYGAGSCPICTESCAAKKDENKKNHCSFPAPCSFPEKRIGSIEAAGINVTELCKAAGITYNNGIDTVTYFSMVLSNKR